MAVRGSIAYLFCLLVCVCFAQTRPSIPSTFYARVRVNLVSGTGNQRNFWVGGGIYALDVRSGYKRVQFNLDAEEFEVPERIHYHKLERYDMESVYTIDYDRTCHIEPVTGRLETPFKWVDNATFAGESEQNGVKVETWEYTDEAKAYYKVSVKKGTNELVSFIMGHQIAAESDAVLEMTVYEWHETIRSEVQTYIPSTCQGYDKLQGTVSEVVQFADANWDCADVSCSQTVPAGSGQPDYGCAEFAARSLAAGGFIPGLGPTDPQSSFGSWGYNGNTYDLCWTTNLSDALSVLGFQKMANQASSVTAGCAAFGDGGDGYFSHAVIGVGPATDDAHNNARYHYPVADSLYAGIDAVWCPPGGASSGTGSSTGSYYSSMAELQTPANLGGVGSIYDVKPAVSEKVTQIDARENTEVQDNVPVSNELRFTEERAERKFKL